MLWKRLVLVACALLAVAAGQYGTCSGRTFPPCPSNSFYAPNQLIPNDDSYKADDQCDYLITVPVGRVALNFSQLRIEYNANNPAPQTCDDPMQVHVALHDGVDESAPLIGRLCSDSGTTADNVSLILVPPIVSSGTSLFVAFKNSRFWGYTFPPGASQYGIAATWGQTNAPASGACYNHSDLTGATSGIIATPYPYGPNTAVQPPAILSFATASCSWTIKGALWVEWQVNAIASLSTLVSVYNGPSADQPFPLASYTADVMGTIDGPVRSTRSVASQYLTLTSASLNEPHWGFNSSFLAHDTPETYCQGLIGWEPVSTFTGGTVQMPYPYDGTTKPDLGLYCRFTISMRPQMTNGGSLSITIDALDILSGTLIVHDDACPLFRGFNLFQGQTLSAADLPPARPIITTGPAACIEFGTTSDATAPLGSGFKISYVASNSQYQCQSVAGTEVLLGNKEGTLANPKPFVAGQPFMTAVSGMNCTWLVQPNSNDARVPALYIKYAQLVWSPACSLMGIEVYDGPLIDPSKLLGRFCHADFGATPLVVPRVWPSDPNHSMLVRLYSEVDATVPGIQLETIVTNLVADPTAPIRYCSGHQLANLIPYVGTFAAVEPFNVGAGLLNTVMAEEQNCSLTIDAGLFGRVLLQFDPASFFTNVFPPMFAGDSLDIYEGLTINDGPPVLSFTGDSGANWADYTSLGQYVTIHFRSDNFTNSDPMQEGGFKLNWRVLCPFVHQPNTPGRTVSQNATHMIVDCDSSTACPGRTISVCDTSGYWQPEPQFCHYDCSLVEATNNLLQCAPNPSYADTYEDCPCPPTFHLNGDSEQTRMECITERYYGAIPSTNLTCPPITPTTCDADLGLGGFITVDKVAPEILPLAGGMLTISGSLWQLPLQGVQVGAAVVDDASDITQLDAQTASVVVPAGAGSGYVSVLVLDNRGSTGRLDGVLFLTDDCPVAGQYGVGADCHPCPEGAVCPGGNRLWPLPGYWNENEAAGYVVACPNPSTDRCLGGRNSTCGAGYTGTQCASCVSGYYQSGVVCAACPPAKSQIALYVVNAVVFAILSACMVLLKDAPLGYVVKVFKLLQILRAAGERSGAVLPDGMRYINDYLALITFDYNFLQPACGSDPVQPQFSTIFWGNAVVILCLVAPSLLVMTGLAILSKEKRTFWLNRISRAVIIFSTLIYFVVATRVLQATTCIDVGTVSVLRADPSTLCDANAVVVIGGIGLAAVVLYPLSYLFFLIRLYRQDGLADKDRKARFGYMYRRLKLTKFRFLFESLALTHLFFLALAWNVFPAGRSPYAFSIFSYSLLIVAVIAWRPFTSPRATAFVIASYGVGLASTVANLMTLNVAQYTTGASIGVVIAVGVVVLLIAAAVLVYELRDHKKEHDEDKSKDKSKGKSKDLSGEELESKVSGSETEDSAVSASDVSSVSGSDE